MSDDDEELADNSLRVVALLRAAWTGDVEGYDALKLEADGEFIDALTGFALAATSTVSALRGLDINLYLDSLQITALELARRLRDDN